LSPPAPQGVELIGTRGQKLTRIGSLSACPALTTLCLRSNLIGRMHQVAGQTSLTHLELYENRVRRLEGLGGMSGETAARAPRRPAGQLPLRTPPPPILDRTSRPARRGPLLPPGPLRPLASHPRPRVVAGLTTLDMSYNKVKVMEGMGDLSSLATLFLASNKVRAIEGLEGSPALTGLDLGMNKVRAIAGVAHLTGLRELWLGKNKITRLEGLETLTNLKRLDVQVSPRGPRPALVTLVHFQRQAIAAPPGLSTSQLHDRAAEQYDDPLHAVRRRATG